MSRWVALGLLLAAVGALALRLPQLDRRPLHNDEGINAVKLRALWEQGRYVYDPDVYHGPALYYAALPFVWLSRARDADELPDRALRLLPVFFGVALVLLLWLLRDALGPAATVSAGVLTAVSPAMVFYSRYFIHEMLLVFFTLLVLAAGWRYSRTRHPGWAVLGGAGLGLMHATKETFVLAVAAMVAGAGMTAVWNRWREQGPSLAQAFKAFWNFKHAMIALAAAALVSVVLFTSFFTNGSGPLDSIRSYLPWLHRAGGHSPHIHPWHFYLERLAWFHERKGPAWSEGFILALAAVGFVTALTRKGLTGINSTFLRFIAFYTVVLTAAYTVISYKTPWCLLGFWSGMLLLAGVGAVVMCRLASRRGIRIAVSVVMLSGAGHLAWQAWQASYIFSADRKNPYVYAQTVPGILPLVEKVEALARLHPQGRQMVVKVMAAESDYWPLPWYLRRCKQVGWWTQVPAEPYAPVMIVDAKFDAMLDEKSNKTWLMAGLFEMRPEKFFELYVELDLWRKYVATLPRETD
jgi:uncharacterized protein (TIGR03663 family)